MMTLKCCVHTSSKGNGSQLPKQQNIGYDQLHVSYCLQDERKLFMYERYSFLGWEIENGE